MSVLSSLPRKIAPNAAAGITLSTPSAASSWGNGSWVECIASTSAPIAITGAVADTTDDGAPSQFEIDIGIGAAGSEVVIATIRWYAPNTAGGGPGSFQLPIAIGGITSGVRVSMRRRRNASAVGSCRFNLEYIENPDTDQVTTAILCAAPSAANQVTLTPHGTAWNNSSWAELTTGLADPSGLAGLALRLGVVDQDFEIDIGMGAAGAEAVITTLRARSWTLTSGLGLRCHVMLPFVYFTSSTARIAYRLRKSGTSTTQWSAALMYYGALAVAAPRVRARAY